MLDVRCQILFGELFSLVISTLNFAAAYRSNLAFTDSVGVFVGRFATVLKDFGFGSFVFKNVILPY